MHLKLKATLAAVALALTLTVACSRHDQAKAQQTVNEAAKTTEKALDTAGDKAKEAWDKTKTAAKDASDSHQNESAKPSAVQKSGHKHKATQ
jgi:hypothetical protein